MALPLKDEEIAPEFIHYDAPSIPSLASDGAELRIIAGDAYGKHSPVKVYSPLFYVDVKLNAGARLDLPNNYADQALYVIEGVIDVEGTSVGSTSQSHIVFLGGEPFDEPRHIWWNFVSSSKDRIEEAKAEWKSGRFAPIPGDDKEFIPLPP